MTPGALGRRVGQGLWTAWDRFFFTPESTAPLAVFRIAYGVVVTLWTLTQLPHLFVFYGPDGVLPTPLPVAAGQWSLLTMANSVPVLAVVWLATLLAGIALAVGASPRFAAVVLLVGLIAFTRRDPYVLNSGDILLRVLAVYLVFAPSAESLSWDRWRRDKEHFWEFPRRAPWAMRMLQVQLSVIYLAAVWAKLQGDVWRNGTAVTYALRMLDQLRIPSPDFVAGSPLLVEWFTFGTLLTELSIGLFVWNRRARPWVLAAGVLMHLSIEIFIMIGFFSMAIWCLYLVFLPPEGTERAVLALRDRWRARRGPNRSRTAEREPTLSDAP